MDPAPRDTYLIRPGPVRGQGVPHLLSSKLPWEGVGALDLFANLHERRSHITVTWGTFEGLHKYKKHSLSLVARGHSFFSSEVRKERERQSHCPVTGLSSFSCLLGAAPLC
ncbi:unnamed protein product [Ixodes persulcatus]